MKNNKGFTLIEIIGVIVILGIIAIIAFATYTNSLKDFRDSYYLNLENTIEKSGEEFFNDNRNYRPNTVLEAKKVNIGTLESKDYISKVVDYNGDECDTSSYVLIVKEGKGNFSYHTCLACSKDSYNNQGDTYCDSSWLIPTNIKYSLEDANDIYIYLGTTKEELIKELELPISYARIHKKLR